MKSYDNYFLPTENMEETIEFYKKIGLKEKFSFPENGIVAFSVGDEEPAIILKDIKNFPEQKPTVWFVVEDTQKEYNRLKKAGVEFLSEPFLIRTGTSVEFKDTFGNILGMTDYTEAMINKK